MSSTVLEISNVKKYFPVHGGLFLRQQGNVHAVDDVSFAVKRGETLGLVGESGCGKTTLGRCIMGLYDLSEGTIKLHGKDTAGLKGAELKNLRLKMQMVFQDPFESLNSRHTVKEILEEKYIIHNRLNSSKFSWLPSASIVKKNGEESLRGKSVEDEKSMDDELSALLERVGLSKSAMSRFPHEFSGGQRQRIGIARAISLNPEVIICDEPVSALDVSVQSQILNLLLELQRDMGLTTLFISHDLSVVRHVSDRIAVMYLGKIVEIGDAVSVYRNPSHPYTQAMISAVPMPDPEAKRKRIILEGEVPSPITPP
ncbi:ABC transporter ATP-binding protein [Desulfamplus magnetovallimortis]|uniref:ABC transporter ATP-binding protein n=1 Tax=Desulfamplus magnetovallimortis TaxID=1246637 RepID=UPI003CCBA1F6